MQKSRNNYYRSRIINENLLYYMEEINMSDRNKNVVKKYVIGVDYKTLSIEYGVTTERIRAIIGNFVVRATIIKSNDLGRKSD